MIARNIYFIILRLVVSASAFADSLFVQYDSSSVGHANAQVYIGSRGPYHLCAKRANSDCNGKKSYLDINPYRDREISLPQYNLSMKTSLGMYRPGGCNYTVTLGKDFSIVDVNNNGSRYCSYQYSRHKDTDIKIFKDAHVSIAHRTLNSTVNFPQAHETFSKVVLNLHLRCPSGGCDPWDRVASLYLIGGKGQKIELFRFITPYRVGVDLSQDITDLRPLLVGKKTLQVFIDTWVGSGWLVS